MRAGCAAAAAIACSSVEPGVSFPHSAMPLQNAETLQDAGIPPCTLTKSQRRAQNTWRQAPQPPSGFVHAARGLDGPPHRLSPAVLSAPRHGAGGRRLVPQRPTVIHVCHLRVVLFGGLVVPRVVPPGPLPRANSKSLLSSRNYLFLQGIAERLAVIIPRERHSNFPT